MITCRFFSLVLLATSLAAASKKETFVRLTQEEINGTMFTHRSKVYDGTVEDTWTINGKHVDGDEYEAAYLKAKTAELQQERQMREQEHRQHEMEIAQQQKFARAARIGIHKRTLHELIEIVEQEMQKLNDERLMPYRVFDATTYATPEHLAHLNRTVAKAKQMTSENEDELTERVLSNMHEELANHPARLKEFYRASVKQAINTCDNTQLLKELLELLG